MTKRTNRSIRKNWTRLISGLFVGGVLLFQGTGFITSNMAKAENSNIEIPTVGIAISDTDYTYGLIGQSGTSSATVSDGSIQINGDAVAVLGELDTTVDTRTLVGGTELTMDTHTIYVGDESKGTLYIGGKNASGSAVSSKLILNANGTFTADGLSIGNSATSKGSVYVLNGSSIVNNTSVNVQKSGFLSFGTDEDLITGSTAYVGDGQLKNSGTVWIFNESGADNAMKINYYVDDENGSIIAGGDLLLQGNDTLTINGEVEADNLALNAYVSEAGTGGIIEVNGDVTVDKTLTMAATKLTEAGTYVVDETETATMKIGEDGVIEAKNWTLDSKQQTVTNEGSVKIADTMTISDGTLTSSGSLSAKAMGINGGTVTSTGNMKVGSLALNDGTFTASGTLAGQDSSSVIDINGGTLDLGGTLTLTNATLNYNGGSIGTKSTSKTTLMEIGSKSIFNVQSTDKPLYTSIGVKNGGSLDLSDGGSLTLAQDRSFTVDKGGTILVNFNETYSPAVTLEGDGIATLATGSAIDVGDVSKLAASATPYKLTVVTSESDESSYDPTLSKSNSAFLSLQGYTDTYEEGNAYVLELNVRNFQDLGLSENQRAFGGYVDSFRTTGNYSSALGGTLSDIMKLESADQVREVYDTMMAPQKANSMMLAVGTPWQYAFDQMNYGTHYAYTQVPGCGGGTCNRGLYRGQEAYYSEGYGCCPSLTPHSGWANFHHTDFNANGDANSPYYGIARTGVTVGYDMVNGEDIIAGLAFEYAQPHLHSGPHRINMSDFKFGLYGKRYFCNDAELVFYVGGGAQNYTSKRTVQIQSIGLNDYHQATYNGKTFSAALQFARSFSLNYWSVVRPFAQLDTECIWQDAFEETGGVSALAYEKADWNRSFVRAGFETEANNRYMRITGRAYYAGQISKQSAPEMTASFVQDYTDNTMLIRGVDLEKGYFDVGCGALGYLDCCHHCSITGNYDFSLGDKSKAHTGSVALSYNF